jgi:hypothetical protein
VISPDTPVSSTNKTDHNPSPKHLVSLQFSVIERHTFYSFYLKCYPPTNKHLNYESVNENKQKYGTRKQQYDYKITDAVEFSKLFLLPNMAHYAKFA